MIQYNAYDQDNIPRVWGRGNDDKQAIQQCELALKEYLGKRPWYKNKTYKIKKDKK